MIPRLDTEKKPMNRKTAYELTLQRTQFLRKNGYRVVEKWEHEKPTPWANTHCPKVETETYPHAIVYDFESYQDTSKAVRPTSDLFYESEHVPISVSLADTLNPEPEYIVSRDPAELIRLFHQSLERRHEAIVAAVVKEFSFSDTEGIPEKQSNEIVKWFHQVPVLGFNSGHYDLKLIRQHFIPLLAQDPGTFAAEKNGRIMFINTPKFKFLDVLNYLGPGITYEKWVKTYGATLAKSWLPYEWLDSPDKLDFPGLPPYMAWYSKLKGEYVLTLKEYDDCHRIFKERGMQTFGDWLEYYNNLDVAPFLEALQKMKEFYTSLGIDILKDAVSLPGVSEKYILRKTLQPRWGYKPPELYSPNKEAYAMLKAAVVGGPSLVFTRKHVAGETRIRSHQYEAAKVCRRILGYDANSLYPSTMMKEMPCGPGFVKSYDNPEAYARVFPQFLWTEEWFGFAEVDIEVPEELWPEFEEFPPLFINRGVPDSAVPQHMHDYLQQSGRKRFPEQKKLLGVMSAKKILLYAPLLAWYLNQGLKLTAVYRTIDYEPREIFSWFVNEVANNRRKGDAEKDKALLAEVFKLLGNSAYGKFIEAVERHTNTIYTRDEEEVDKSLRSARFKTLEEIGPASWSTSSRSSACSSSTTSSLTSTWTGETSSLSRWTQTACTLLYPARGSRMPSALGTRPSSRRKRSVGWPGTSGATASLVYSSSRRRPPVVSHFAASATTWRTRPPARRRCLLRGLTSGRTRCAGRVSSGLLRAIGTWLSTGAFECGTAQCTRTSSASSV